MAGPEMKIHNWFLTQLKKMYGDNFIHIKPPAGIYSSRKGISDFILCIYGKFIAVEVKVEGNNPTAIQDDFLKKVTTAGGLSLVLHGKDMTIFNKINEFVDEQ